MRNIVRHIRQSLSWKLSLGILLMAVPIFVLSLGILYAESRDNVKKEALEHANSVLSTTMERVSRYMGMIETATDINDWAVTANLHPDSLLAYSNFIVSINGSVDGCSISTEPNVFPKYGRYFSAYTVRESDTVTTVIEEEYEYFEKVWYKQPRQLGKPCWVIYFDESDSLALTLDGMIASYSKPLYDDEEKFVGVISTDLSLLHLSRIISEEKPYPDSYFMMVGEEGRYLVHPDTVQLFTHTIFSDVDPREQSDVIALGHEMTTGKEGNMRVVINGEHCLVTYRPVPNTNWSLALVCPERNILQSYNRQNYIITPLIIVGLLLILLFCSIVVARSIRPLNKLADKLQRIAEGHYDEQIKKTDHQDVVGRLQNNFASMQESLSNYVNNIQQMNEETIRRNEELARTSELAQEADRQKTLFIQNVSRQVRTPLNIIMGFGQVLRESRSMLPKEEAASVVDTMKHNAMMLDRMTLMLYDSSAKGATEERYTMRNEEVSCNDVARECIRYTQEHYPGLPVRFKSDLPDDFCINTSRLYLMRSIREILYNSAKYSDGKNIMLHVAEIGSMVHFIFTDTGPGIKAEEIDHLFDTFTKVNDLSEGLGLGLPLAKRHVNYLGGDLIFDANYHDGCRFIIQLPKV